MVSPASKWQNTSLNFSLTARHADSGFYSSDNMVEKIWHKESPEIIFVLWWPNIEPKLQFRSCIDWLKVLAQQVSVALTTLVLARCAQIPFLSLEQDGLLLASSVSRLKHVKVKEERRSRSGTLLVLVFIRKQLNQACDFYLQGLTGQKAGHPMSNTTDYSSLKLGLESNSKWTNQWHNTWWSWWYRHWLTEVWTNQSTHHHLLQSQDSIVYTQNHIIKNQIIPSRS